MNVAMTADGSFAEVQASSEREPLSRHALSALLDLAEQGCRELLRLQQAALQAT